jgi:RND family efflux transporter MFP subunit
MKRVLALLAVLAAGFGGGLAFQRWYAARQPQGSGTDGGRKILYWHDPMHPWYRSDKPGIAPDCNMPLEPVYADAPAAEPERKVLFYVDPHDPKYRSDKPGLNPETGNELKPVYEEQPAGAVQVTAEKQQLIGLKTAPAEVTAAGRSFRTVGRVVLDETTIVRVHPRVDGWIEKVHVDYIGEQVRAGQPLLTMYSPEMLASQEEYLLALRGAKILKDSPVPDSDRQAYSLIEASRRRLELFDMSEGQVEQIAKSGKPIRDITLYAPSNGFVMVRNAYPKQRVMPDTELYQIADLSRVWIMADVFEADASGVRASSPATVTLPSGARSFSARVAHILPVVDPQTRTLRVRLEAPNPGMQLRPDMYVDVDFRIGAESRLTVPAEAVINTGLRQVVYVATGNGTFEPRNVQTGESLNGRVAVISGLRAGDQVVTSGNFLIDSESQLKSIGGPPAPAAAAAPVSGQHGGHSHD